MLFNNLKLSLSEDRYLNEACDRIRAKHAVRDGYVDETTARRQAGVASFATNSASFSLVTPVRDLNLTFTAQYRCGGPQYLIHESPGPWYLIHVSCLEELEESTLGPVHLGGPSRCYSAMNQLHKTRCPGSSFSSIFLVLTRFFSRQSHYFSALQICAIQHFRFPNPQSHKLYIKAGP